MIVLEMVEFLGGVSVPGRMVIRLNCLHDDVQVSGQNNSTNNCGEPQSHRDLAFHARDPRWAAVLEQLAGPAWRETHRSAAGQEVGDAEDRTRRSSTFLSSTLRASAWGHAWGRTTPQVRSQTDLTRETWNYHSACPPLSRKLPHCMLPSVFRSPPRSSLRTPGSPGRTYFNACKAGKQYCTRFLVEGSEVTGRSFENGERSLRRDHLQCLPPARK